MKLTESKDISSDTIQSERIQECSKRRRAFKPNRRNVLFSRLSQEICSKLNAIMGFSEVMVGTKLSEEQNRYVHFIYEAGSAVMSQVDYVLEYLKIQAGDVEVNIQVCCLERVLEEVAAVAQPRADKKGIGLEFIRQDGLPVDIGTDTMYFRQCLLQVAQCAIEATERDQIRLKIYPENRNSQLCLRFDFEEGGPNPETEQNKVLATIIQDTAKKAGCLTEDAGWELIIANQWAQLLGGGLSVGSEDKPNVMFSLWVPTETVSESSSDPDKTGQDKQAQEIDMLLSDISGSYGQIRNRRSATSKTNNPSKQSSNRPCDRE